MPSGDRRGTPRSPGGPSVRTSSTFGFGVAKNGRGIRAVAAAAATAKGQPSR